MEKIDKPPWEAFLHAGHTHDPQRGMSRRQMLGTAGAAGAILMTGFRGTALAAKPGTGAPNPIPHVAPFGPFHFFFPGRVDGSAAPTDPTGTHPGRDPSTIFDFNGFIGSADLNLSGTGTDTTTHETKPYTFHTDMRFMQGVFVDTAGRNQRGTFAFI